MHSNLNFSYLGPAKPVNITAKAVGTDRLSIGWALPEGSADYYIVNIINKSETTNSSSVTVTGLSPGRVYEVNVTAVAGNFTNKSEPAFIATSKIHFYIYTVFYFSMFRLVLHNTKCSIVSIYCFLCLHYC